MRIIFDLLHGIISPSDNNSPRPDDQHRLLDTRLQKILFWVSFNILGLVSAILCIPLLFTINTLLIMIIVSPWVFMILGYALALYLKDRLHGGTLRTSVFLMFLFLPYVPLACVFMIFGKFSLS